MCMFVHTPSYTELQTEAFVGQTLARRDLWINKHPFFASSFFIYS